METVTQITLRLKGHVEKSFQNVAVQGEISGGKLWSSGHYYASLKDKGAVLNLKMWSSAFQRVPFEIEEGMQIVAYGKLEVYAPRGAYSLVAERLEPLGQGALDLAFRQIFERLQAQGLFEETRKRPLPQFPRRVAVITSAAGAALRDFWRVVRDRWPLADLLVIDSLVQGDKAAAQLTAAVQMAGTLQHVDLIVLTRGGGSREDLWAFNDENLAYAIAASPVPVVSAVGHEIDVSMSDYVADCRVATPTHAATTVFPDVLEIHQSIDSLEMQLRNAIDQRLIKTGNRVGELDRRLTAAGSRIVERASSQTQALHARLNHAMASIITRRQSDLQRQAAVLDSLSPLKVLGRGFSVTLAEDGKTVVRSVNELKSGDLLETRLPDGRAISRVEKVDPLP